MTLHFYIYEIIEFYRDLKPENCLIGVFGEIKLADFGWSFKFDNSVENKESAMAGTLDYLSPEIISNEGYDKKIDNWCLGKNILFKKIKFNYLS